MIIYKCRFTGDEVCSDAFKLLPVTDENGDEVPGLMQVESAKVNKNSGANVDIGCGGAFGESGGEEAVDETVELVNNIVDETFGFNLTTCPMGKKDLKEYLGDYCKNLRTKLKDDPNVPGPDVKAFTQAAPKFCKYLLSQYSELDFFTSVSMDPDGAMAFAIYGEKVDPNFMYIKAGLLEEKC
mmetsp:Transcript_36519/g.43635  ORF Transcript_36519/g.43635 Transcript_36519/m.43635 type:complete len:183 (+) Transcript_36519:82-630(+)